MNKQHLSAEDWLLWTKIESYVIPSVTAHTGFVNYLCSKYNWTKDECEAIILELKKVFFLTCKEKKELPIPEKLDKAFDRFILYSKEYRQFQQAIDKTIDHIPFHGDNPSPALSVLHQLELAATHRLYRKIFGEIPAELWID